MNPRPSIVFSPMAALSILCSVLNSTIIDPDFQFILTDVFAASQIALRDALECMRGSPTDEMPYIHTIEEHRAQRRVVSAAVDLLVPPRLPVYSCNGYHGPWFEDLWINLQDSSDHAFGLFIPIFLPWLQLWLLECRHRGAPVVYWTVLNKLFRRMSPNFLYVTVVQNADGLQGRESKFRIPSNIFILSQGGKGHIPILQFRGLMVPDESFGRCEYDAVFAGIVDFRRSCRAEMVRDAQLVLPNTSLISEPVDNWTDLYRASKTVLCPRGYGRTSFRLSEVLQMGLIPIYIYNDFPWVAYYDSVNWSSFGYIVQVDKLAELLREVHEKLTREKVSRMRERVRSLYHTHWTPEASLGQIFNLLNYGFGRSDLRCGHYSKSRDETRVFKLV
jgi:hypothetical protein